MLYQMTSAAPLGFNIIEVLLHLFNLAILVIGIRFLLYKPIKKFMDKRSAEYKSVEERTKKNQEEIEAWNSEYATLKDDARREAQDIELEGRNKAENEAQEILERAKKEAKEMIEKAEVDIASKKAEIKEEMSAEVSDLAINIAAKVLEREVKAEDNDAVINSILDDWKKK